MSSLGHGHPVRDGRVIYYRRADGFPHQFLEHRLRQLLTISAGRDPDGDER